MAQPDFHICVGKKNQQQQKIRYHRVGAAWIVVGSGNISVKLDDGVVLDWRMCETHLILLISNTKKPAIDGGFDPGLDSDPFGD